jgi:hypothetical protein
LREYGNSNYGEIPQTVRALERPNRLRRNRVRSSRWLSTAAWLPFTLKAVPATGNGMRLTGRSDNRGNSTNAFGSLYSTHSDLLLHRTEVSLHPIHSHGNRIQQVRMFREHGREVAMNNIAKLPFELSVQISRTRLKPHRGTGIVEY